MSTSYPAAVSSPHLGESYRSPLLKKQMPGLDVLRGIAVLSVLFYHGLYWYVPANSSVGVLAGKVMRCFVFGWLGVNLFFVLSGFLITGILLDSRAKPGYARSFYIRRMRRILPAYLLILAVLKVYPGISWKFIMLSLVYLSNFADFVPGIGYGYSVLWSLAVEEQFYLVWPWVVRWLSSRALFWVSVGSILFSPLLRYASWTGTLPLGDPHSMTWLISDSLAIGAVMALFLRSRWGNRRNAKRLMIGMFVFGSVLLVAGAPFGILHRANGVGAALQNTTFEFLFAAMLVMALFVGDKPQVFRWTVWLRFLGYISYGLYLYHLLGFYLYDKITNLLGLYRGSYTSAGVFLRFIITSVVMVFISWISRRYFEDRFLRRKEQSFPVTAAQGE